MRFNPKAGLDRSRVGDAGRGGGGGGLGGGRMRLPIPGGTGGRMGGWGLLIIILLYVLAQCMGASLPGPGGGSEPGSGADPGTSQNGAQPGGTGNDAEGTKRYAKCRTGADANESQDCARVAVENSLRDFWEGQLRDDFEPADRLVTFSGQVQTGCGAASSQVGPFYCPADLRIYLDTTFFDEVLEQQLGGPDGGFVEFYVIAHEYGHHISNITGQMRQVKSQQGPDSDAVKLELQADCYAGMWAQHATSTRDENGEVLITELTEEDIQLAIEGAEAVGDDRIQEKTQGRVTPESWTHGSAEARKAWFMHGFEAGDPNACDTWRAGQLQGEDWLPAA